MMTQGARVDEGPPHAADGLANPRFGTGIPSRPLHEHNGGHAG
jgi:hypothetical protein